MRRFVYIIAIVLVGLVAAVLVWSSLSPDQQGSLMLIGFFGVMGLIGFVAYRVVGPKKPRIEVEVKQKRRWF